MRAAVLKGGLSLAGARVGQGIMANDVTVDGPGRAIEADVMHLGGNWIMRSGKIKGSIRFAGAQIEGQVAFTACEIDGGGDLAIRADGAQIARRLVHGPRLYQGPRPPAGRAPRQRDAPARHQHTVTGGPAIFANGVTIARELVLDGGFSSTGAIALDHAQIDGTIDLSRQPHHLRQAHPRRRAVEVTITMPYSTPATTSWP